MRCLLAFAWALAAAGMAHAAADDRANVFNMTSGTVVIARSEYNDSKWSSYNLFDEDPKSLWCSPEGKPRARSSRFPPERSPNG